jgi:hypothetical protein
MLMLPLQALSVRLPPFRQPSMLGVPMNSAVCRKSLDLIMQLITFRWPTDIYGVLKL